jgi:aminopeptidase N
MPKPVEVWAVSARVQKPRGDYVEIKDFWTKSKEQAMRKAKEFLNFFKRRGYRVTDEMEDKEDNTITWFLEREEGGKTLRAAVHIVGVPF